MKEKLKIGFLNVYPYEALRGQKKGLKFGYSLYVSKAIFDCLLDDDTRDLTFSNLDWIELPYFDPALLINPDYIKELEKKGEQLKAQKLAISGEVPAPPPEKKQSKSRRSGRYLLENESDKMEISNLEKQYGSDLISTILVVFCDDPLTINELELISAAAASYQKYQTWETPVFALLPPWIRDTLKINEDWFLI